MEAVEGCYAAWHCRLSFVISDWLPSSGKGRSYLIWAGPRRGEERVTEAWQWRAADDGQRTLRYSGSASCSLTWMNRNHQWAQRCRRGWCQTWFISPRGVSDHVGKQGIQIMLHIHNDGEKNMPLVEPHIFSPRLPEVLVTQIYLTPMWTASLQLV